MKKIVKFFVVLISFILIFSSSAFCEGSEFYYQQYEEFGLSDLEQLLPDFARDSLNDIGIDADNPDFGKNINGENIFSHIFSLFKNGFSEFKGMLVSLIFICILAAAASCFCDRLGCGKIVNYISVLSICTAVLLPIFNHINTVITAIKTGSVFMISFVPIFVGMLTLSGGSAAASGSATLLIAIEAVNLAAALVILPLLCGYLALSVAASVYNNASVAKLCGSVKKFLLWGLSGILTVFIGVISLQTTVSSAADTLTGKTAKYMISSVVPVVGPALSESLATVMASFKLLRSSSAVYAIFAVAAIFLPVIAETLLWQLCIKIAQTVAGVFSQNKISDLLNPVGDALTVMLGIILFVFALFVISLSIIVKAGAAL